MKFSGKDASPLVHGSTDCSFLYWQGLLSTKGDAAACESRQCSHSGKPLGKRAETPQSCMMYLQKERRCPCFWPPLCPFHMMLLVFVIAYVWLLHTRKHVALSSQLISSRPRLDTSCTDCQCMLLLIKFLVGKVCLVGFFRSSKFQLKSKRRKSGQRTSNGPRGRCLGSPWRLGNLCFKMSVPLHSIWRVQPEFLC